MASPDVPVLRPPAEFTHATAGLFDAALSPHLEGRGPGVVVDLGAVSTITSAGLSLLVDAGRRLSEQGRPLALAGGARAIVKLLRIVGLDAVMPHFPTIPDAAAWVCDQVPDSDA